MKPQNKQCTILDFPPKIHHTKITMRIPVMRLLFYFVLSIGVIVSLLTFFPKNLVSLASAQTSSSFTAPDMDADVPKNLHTLSQAVTIDVLSAVICQIVGVDPVNPDQPCLGINPETNKIGFSSANQSLADGNPQNQRVGGMLGVLTTQISTLYNPPASSTEYTRYLADNFGLVKSANADTKTSKEGLGFGGLTNIRKLWQVSLDIAYSLLVLAFIFIGLGVMLRVRIDPRTVMTIQNQIPRVIMTLLLITFSYAIVGVMIDFMWVATYVGINTITRYNNPKIGSEGNLLSKKATETLLQSPLTYAYQIFSSETEAGGGVSGLTKNHNGLLHLTQSVSGAIGQIVEEVVKKLVGAQDKCSITNANECIKSAVAYVMGYIAHVVIWLIVLVAIIVALFRVWWMLLKAYVFIVFYTVAAPIWISFGLLPGRPLGFEKWIRAIFVKIVVFPLTALIFVGARVLMDMYKDGEKVDPNATFVAPLIGNPNMNFGALLAFGAILMAPTILTMLEEKMKVPGNKQGAAIAGTIGAAAGIAGAPAQRMWAASTKRNAQTGAPMGPVSKFGHNIYKGTLSKGAKIFGPKVANKTAEHFTKMDNMYRGLPHGLAKDMPDHLKPSAVDYPQWKKEQEVQNKKQEGGASANAGTPQTPNVTKVISPQTLPMPASQQKPPAGTPPSAGTAKNIPQQTLQMPSSQQKPNAGIPASAATSHAQKQQQAGSPVTQTNGGVNVSNLTVHANKMDLPNKPQLLSSELPEKFQKATPQVWNKISKAVAASAKLDHGNTPYTQLKDEQRREFEKIFEAVSKEETHETRTTHDIAMAPHQQQAGAQEAPAPAQPQTPAPAPAQQPTAPHRPIIVMPNSTTHSATNLDQRDQHQAYEVKTENKIVHVAPPSLTYRPRTGYTKLPEPEKKNEPKDEKKDEPK